MGRGKLEMKYTEDRRKRVRIYKSRIAGAVKKAHDLSVLCGVDVLFASFSPDLRTLQCWPDDPSDFQRIIRSYQAKKPHASPSDGCVPSSTWTHENELAAIDRKLGEIRERINLLEPRTEASPAEELHCNDRLPFPDLPLSSLEGMPNHTVQLCPSAEEPGCYDDLPHSLEGMFSASPPHLADSSSSAMPASTEDPTDLGFLILHDIAEYLAKPLPSVSCASKAFADCYWELCTQSYSDYIIMAATDLDPVFPSAQSY